LPHAVCLTTGPPDSVDAARILDRLSPQTHGTFGATPRFRAAMVALRTGAASVEAPHLATEYRRLLPHWCTGCLGHVCRGDRAPCRAGTASQRLVADAEGLNAPAGTPCTTGRARRGRSADVRRPGQAGREASQHVGSPLGSGHLCVRLPLPEPARTRWR